MSNTKLAVSGGDVSPVSQYEFLVRDFLFEHGYPFTYGEMQRQLNALGAEGWQLVTMHIEPAHIISGTTSYKAVGVFQRPASALKPKEGKTTP